MGSGLHAVEDLSIAEIGVQTLRVAAGCHVTLLLLMCELLLLRKVSPVRVDRLSARALSGR